MVQDGNSGAIFQVPRGKGWKGHSHLLKGISWKLFLPLPFPSHWSDLSHFHDIGQNFFTFIPLVRIQSLSSHWLECKPSLSYWPECGHMAISNCKKWTELKSIPWEARPVFRCKVERGREQDSRNNQQTLSQLSAENNSEESPQKKSTLRHQGLTTPTSVQHLLTRVFCRCLVWLCNFTKCICISERVIEYLDKFYLRENRITLYIFPLWLDFLLVQRYVCGIYLCWHVQL